MPHNRTREPIIYILANDTEMGSEVFPIFEPQGYRFETCTNLSELTSQLSSRPGMAVILDLDSILLDNRGIRNLALSFPCVSFFGVSHDRFHPELKDAICFHLFACLTRPIDPDELHFFLKCIRDKSIKEEI
jgi:hypothetical protein